MNGEHDEDSWDDLAIIRAFEDAIKEQKICRQPTECSVQMKDDTDSVKVQGANVSNEVSEIGQSSAAKKTGTSTKESMASKPNIAVCEPDSRHIQEMLLGSRSQTSSSATTAAHRHQPSVEPSYPSSINFVTASDTSIVPPMLSTFTEGDSLSDLLLSWYRLGFQTGRYQTIQELKLKHNS